MERAYREKSIMTENRKKLVEVKNVFTNDVFFVNYIKLKHDYEFVNKNINSAIDEYPYEFKFSNKNKKFLFNEVQLYKDAIDERNSIKSTESK